MQIAMQAENHYQGQWSLVVQCFVDLVQFADHRHQIFGRQPGLCHAKLDRFHWIWQCNWIMLALVIVQ